MNGVISGFVAMLFIISSANHLSRNKFCSDRVVNFSGRSGTYWYSYFVEDFGNVDGYSDAERSRHWVNTSQQLKVKLLANQTGGFNGGVCARVHLDPSPEYTFQYRVKFSADFDWCLGGKIPGFGGGMVYAGGDTNVVHGDGWSFRPVWCVNPNLNNGNPCLRLYVYYYGMPGVYGDGLSSSAFYPITDGTWYTVKLHAKMNTAANFDGAISMTVNGETVYENSSFRWVTNDYGRAVDQLMWDVFRGGSGTEYQSDEDWEIFFDDFVIDNALEIEAEDGSLTFPMRKQDGYIYVPYGTGPDPRGTASYTVYVAESAFYCFSAYTACQVAGGGCDSVYLYVDGHLKEATGKLNYWDFPDGTSWTWDSFDVLIYLSAGTHTIKFKQRETGLKIDKFIIEKYH